MAARTTLTSRSVTAEKRVINHSLEKYNQEPYIMLYCVICGNKGLEERDELSFLIF